MQLQILKLESPDDNILTTFSDGLHKVGRGPLLQCNDSRISREHAAIEITNNEAKLTSLHLNPCFLKVANSKTITILTKDNTTNLHDGDKFAFLPDLFWFRVKVNNDPRKLESGKRLLSDLDELIPEKRIKTEEADLNYDPITDVAIDEVSFEPYSSQIKEENSNEQLKIECEEEETNLSHKIEIKSEEPENPEIKPTTEEKNNAKEVIDEKIKPKSAEASTSNGTTSRRDRCWYVPNCYRKNMQHKADFSHPGDEDYDSDPSDTRPMCQFGANCYRTNVLHRQHFKHPAGKPSRTKIRNRGKKPAGSSSTSYQLNDDYEDEEQDPFFCDDDSDEYQAFTSSSDSEDDSENINDGEEYKKLLKEAKRFVKKK